LQVKRLRSTNPIPPKGIALTTWLYWLVFHWLDEGQIGCAGKTLWNATGVLPGFGSGAWLQLGLILSHLLGEVVRDPQIWLLTSLVREVAHYSHNSLVDPQGWLSVSINFPMDASTTTFQRSECTRILDEYRESLRQFSATVSHDAAYITEMALGFDPSSRSNLWIRKHAFSALKTINPEQEIEIRVMPFVYQPKQLYEVVLDFARKENNWELKLAACESLVSWNVQETKVILAENRITELPTEYYNRSIILRSALEWSPGYVNWV
jgi:hypothetical protein